ncbi:threonylcarbamoyladenosine tRNA methylthiotransferase MtaB [Caldalkalibacillus thermarum]|uniref:tRNA (N(6)-L-threonylcarbamoyladenosine(37)-C(2))- methylthiotransferase MtaB n=1 Tax=Caldalkalibacillus thermarum TaxID=296745 RepID=UPI00166F493C|nr:tRNA (N(6)-L-threonylcarbamoyladenosine(37)-C(2))-methylthiotransferase MtaB [Caldalkalibacillus thermarum]GGK18465.1 threonylcarbamoyladenosine tRNA methylthiotransferase MtaB [Caldalkalibacillus thermarum]
MATVAFHTLGCKVNYYETEAIWQIFKEAGYEKVDFEQVADVYVINTCTVTNTGDRKSRQVIRRAIRRNPDAVICVTGCYAQTSPKEVMAIEGVDIVIGTQGRSKIIDYIEQYRREREPINAVGNIMKTRTFEELDVPTFSERTRAYLKIQEGCNNFCTFCIIPWARGLLRSRKPENVLNQARKLVASGYKEIVLTGIHTAGYGEDLEDYSFAQLLWDLEQIEGLERLRISSIEASQITDDVINVLQRSSKICRHLHIPLQAGDDTVLKRMRRKYTTAEFKAKIEEVRQALPNFALTSDVIVGFPGETEEQFMNTYHFIRDLRFAELHVFPYSPRTGTPAARMKDQVDPDVKQERVQRLIALSVQLSKEYASQFEGQILGVIPEQHYEQNPDLLVGYTDNYLRVVFKGDDSLMGQLVKVQIDRAGYPYNLGSMITPSTEQRVNTA